MAAGFSPMKLKRKDSVAAESILSCARCYKPANLQCPKCVDLKLPREDAAFCTQECFEASWNFHQSIHLKAKLVAGGNSTPDFKILEGEACEILKIAPHSSKIESSNGFPAIVNGAQSAWDMLHEEELFTCITTSCTNLDSIFGGGINCKEVTEIGGVPGIGKTQLGIQLAVNVQIPIDYGGLGGKAIYIDTEGSFMVERALQIAEGCIADINENNGFQQAGFRACPFEMKPTDFLENIFYFRICSYTEHVGLINYLDKFISEHHGVKVIIIDSITFHFRQDFEDLALRTRVLGGMALKLMKLAKKYCMAVVLLNQVTTKYSEGSFHLTLALGDSWSHACTNRVILYWNDNQRYAYIEKSPSLRSASASYSVTSKGIRDSTSTCKRIKMMQVSY